MHGSKPMRLSFFVGIAAVAGVVGMGVHASGRGHTRLGPFNGPPLNPESYRGSIVAVDAVLFEDGPLGESGRTQVTDAMLVIGRLSAADTTNTIAVTLAQNARMLSAMVQHTAVGTPLAGSMLRKEWMRIRGSLFDDASWFRRSSADPIETAEAGPAPASTLRAVSVEARRNLETALFSINLLIGDAREDLPNPTDSDAHRLYLSDTERELVIDSVRVGPPAPMYGIDVFYKSAQGYASDVMEALHQQARLGQGSTAERERLIAKAEEQLAKAKDAAGKMMK
jgi:hypothetical protein